MANSRHWLARSLLFQKYSAGLRLLLNGQCKITASDLVSTGILEVESAIRDTITFISIHVFLDVNVNVS